MFIKTSVLLLLLFGLPRHLIFNFQGLIKIVSGKATFFFLGRIRCQMFREPWLHVIRNVFILEIIRKILVFAIILHQVLKYKEHICTEKPGTNLSP